MPPSIPAAYTSHQMRLVRRLPRLVGVLRHTLCLPILVAARSCLDETRFTTIVRLIERFAFRYITIVGGHAGAPADVYYKQARAIRANPSNYNTASLSNALAQLVQSTANDHLFAANLAEKLSYSSSTTQKRLIRHFLTTLEDHRGWLAGGANGTPQPTMIRVWDLNLTSIEHIYPQNAAAPDPAIEPLKQDIGNLAFWGPGENAAASNDLLPQKAARYQQSVVAMLHALAGLPAWRAQDITSRRQQLINEAIKVFVT